MIEINDDMDSEDVSRCFARALDRGVGETILPLRPECELIVGAGQWASYGAVLVLRRDPQDEQVILYDSYVVGRSPAGDWEPPGASAGSALPPDVLQRPAQGPVDWNDGEMVIIGGQVGYVNDLPVVTANVFASLVIESVQISCADVVGDLAVPASGFVTFPIPANEPSERIEIRGFDRDKNLRATARYPLLPIGLGESDL